MSKQAKRQRQAQREAGIEPALDRKRRLRQEAYDKDQAALAAQAKYRNESPEEYAAERAARQLRLNNLFYAIGILGYR